MYRHFTATLAVALLTIAQPGRAGPLYRAGDVCVTLPRLVSFLHCTNARELDSKDAIRVHLRRRNPALPLYIPAKTNSPARSVSDETSVSVTMSISPTTPPRPLTDYTKTVDASMTYGPLEIVRLPGSSLEGGAVSPAITQAESLSATQDASTGASSDMSSAAAYSGIVLESISSFTSASSMGTAAAGVQASLPSSAASSAVGFPTTSTASGLICSKSSTSTTAQAGSLSESSQPFASTASPSSVDSLKSNTHAAVSSTQASSVPATGATSSLSSNSVAFRPTGELNSMVPTANTHYPTATTTVAANVYANNLVQANNLNRLYSGLTPQTACSGTQVACIDGKIARCQSGSYQLEACTEDQRCLAFPMTNTEGVSVGCRKSQIAKSVLGDAGSSAFTSSAAQVFTTSTTSTEAVPLPTSMEGSSDVRQHSTVTMTTVITIVDGKDSATATSASTSQPFYTAPAPVASQSGQTYGAEPSPEPQGALIVSVISAQSSAPSMYTSEATSSYPESETPAPTSFAYSPFPPLPAAPSKTGHTTILQSIVSPTQTQAAPTEGVHDPKPSESPNGPSPTASVLTIVDLTPKSSSIADSPTESPAAMALGAAQTVASTGKEPGAASTTNVVNGTPTVSVYLTVTVTEKQRETKTVTLIVPAE
ncbi:hypothetical protein HIM_03666 [Hirsutella minnesotensis 3608]|uniref:Carbohydrate-binding module family 19 domain-containing protein n=1 Tax=Hirsutella minnesotensis 3608 TaxID=1043627 RepID=A0A0F8A6B5_9HYPO|nr:hypothetical protein HIM_03666 [Hirsutella minnesotensis 3608]